MCIYILCMLIYVYIDILCMLIYVYIHDIYIYTYSYLFVFVEIYIYFRVIIHVSMYMYMNISIHIFLYISIYMFTLIYEYIHTYIRTISILHVHSNSPLKVASNAHEEFNLNVHEAFNLNQGRSNAADGPALQRTFLRGSASLALLRWTYLDLNAHKEFNSNAHRCMLYRGNPILFLYSFWRAAGKFLSAKVPRIIWLCYGMQESSQHPLPELLLAHTLIHAEQHSLAMAHAHLSICGAPARLGCAGHPNFTI